jgi:hypothetical protein
MREFVDQINAVTGTLEADSAAQAIAIFIGGVLVGYVVDGVIL